MSHPLDVLGPDERGKVREGEQPRWTDPMLATLTREPFSHADWIFERKLDGVRLLVFREGGDTRLMSRNGHDRSATWPEVQDALAGGAPDLVADGELVAFDGGLTSFRRLQERMQVRDEEEARRRSKRVAVTLYLFDLLHFDGHDLTRLPLRARKRVLRKAVPWESPVRWTPHRNADGRERLEEACRRGWEGLIAKDARSRYVHGRSRKWLKLKCGRRQELVVGGFTEPQGSRVGFGSLLLGYHEDGGLRYAGKVGTGWDDARLQQLRDELDRLERKTSPFDSGDPPEGDAGVRWVTPRLVGEVGFTEWTDAGRLRHPRWVGLRRDKDAEDVVREAPTAAAPD